MAGSIPTEQVLNMRMQGLSNNQIVQALQRDGFTSDLIFEALTQADMKSNVGDSSAIQPEQYENPMRMEPQGYPQYPNYGQQEQRQTGGGTEELVEAIIDEKWNELLKNLNKIVEWKEKADQRLTVMEQQVTGLRENFDKLHQAIIGKVSEYDQNILNVGTEIKAMEKVFQKILPTFTENVNALGRYTSQIQGKQPLKKKSIEEDLQ